MLPPRSRAPHLRRHPAGFALIITLSLMILLVLLAVGLLELSAISLRTSSSQRWQSEARANARMAMMLALGQLQLEMGPDARISAPSGVLDTNPNTPTIDGVKLPRLTGIWPAATSKIANFSLGGRAAAKTLRTWLISGLPKTLTSLTLAQNGYAAGTETRTLVAAGSDASLQREVTVPLLTGDNNKAGFAWWTADNGMKATLRAGEKPDTASPSKALLAMRRSEADGHASLDPKLPTRAQGLDQRLLDVGAVNTALPVVAGEQRIAWSKIHDLTTRSEIVPVDVTNVARPAANDVPNSSSLRKCLNTRLNWLDAQSPSTRAAEGTVGPPQLSAPTDATQDYRLFSWDQLRNYESLARASGMLTIDPATKRPLIHSFKQTGFTGNTGGAPTGEPEWNPNISNERFRIQPVLLKLGYVVSYATELLPPPSDPTLPWDPAKPYALRLYIYPMAVLWNPYNVDLTVPEYLASGTCPLMFTINTNQPAPNDIIKVDLTQNQSAIRLAFGPQMGDAKTTNTAKMTNLVIPAGATKVLYPQVVNYKNFGNEYRNSRFIYEYYMWADPAQKFNLGDNNFGGVIKNLRGNNETAFFDSDPFKNKTKSPEIMGGPGDTLKIAVAPSTVSASWQFGMDAAHTDWWGNNGTGDDNQFTLQNFGVASSAHFMAPTNGSPQISLIKPGEVPVRTFGEIVDKPTPLLLYECYHKAADEDLFPGKFGSFAVAGNPIHDAHLPQADTTKDAPLDLVTPWFESAYSFRFRAINSWFDVTKTFQLPPGRDDRVYFGASYSPRGQLNVIDQEIPVSPLVSLAQLQHLPLFDYLPVYDSAISTFRTPNWYGNTESYWFHEGRETQFAQNHAIGNSYASPGIEPNLFYRPGWRYTFCATASHQRMDRSYLANSVLWDSWFCSSVAAQDSLLLQQDSTARTARKVFEDFLAHPDTTPLPNDAMRACLTQSAADTANLLFDANGNATQTAYTRIAEFLRIDGGFNINSVSEEAWAHFLSGLMSRPSLVMESVTGKESPAVVAPAKNQYLISRYALANAQPAERANGQERENRYWNGSREVTAAQVRELAAAIVRQIKLRYVANKGPFTSLAEFVNRSLLADPAVATSGALQSALDDPAVSINTTFRGDAITGAETTTAGQPSYPFQAAAQGPRRQGITGYVTQADLLESIGSQISPRSDTFTIRALGESRDAQGVVLARAWCETVVQRNAAYVDTRDPATTVSALLTRAPNKLFGRRFEIVSFRWLNRNEVE